ncbi:MAG: amino acid ABC transporter substrate-binding protein [Pseudomonadota bacterium]
MWMRRTVFSMAILGLGLGFAGAMPATAWAGDVLDRIKAEKIIRFGFRVDAPPFSAIVNGEPSGFSVDLCKLLAGTIKDQDQLQDFTARMIPVGTGQRFDALAAGEIDVLCGATTTTLERRELVSFSIPTFLTGVSVATRKDAPASLRSVLIDNDNPAVTDTEVAEALRGARLGVRRDTTAADWLTTGPLDGVPDVSLSSYDNHATAMRELRDGVIDAYFADQAILFGFLKANDGADFVVSQKTFTYEPYALALPRGDEDFRLLVDRALSRIYKADGMVGLIERHFGRASPSILLFYLQTALPE